MRNRRRPSCALRPAAAAKRASTPLQLHISVSQPRGRIRVERPATLSVAQRTPHAPPKAKGATYHPGIYHNTSSLGHGAYVTRGLSPVSANHNRSGLREAVNHAQATMVRRLCVTFARSVSHAASCARFATHLARRMAQQPPSSRFRNTQYYISNRELGTSVATQFCAMKSQRSTCPETSYASFTIGIKTEGAPCPGGLHTRSDGFLTV